MSQQPQFLDIIFLAIVVLLLISRLRSVLGTKTPQNDADQKTQSSKIVDISQYRTVDNQEDDKQENTVASAFAEESEIFQNLEKIKTTYPLFDLADFMQKAPKAFEYIATSFANGEKDDLKSLLSFDLYKSFENVINERLKNKETAEFTLISFKSIKLTKAELMGAFVELTVHFETEQTNLLKDSQGVVIVGDPTYIETVTDIWTFRKDMKSSNPAWVLVTTRVKV